jgi:hypothetical protein
VWRLEASYLLPLHALPAQTAAVASYLASGATLPPAGDFNASNRAYPDVAGLAHNVIIYIQGSPEAVDGTSCSTPIFSGIISLANVREKQLQSRGGA